MEYMTSKILYGIVKGRTIELTDDPGVPAGQAVEVIIKTLPRAQSAWGDGLRGCAGALADDWTDEDDRILEEIYQERKNDSRPKPIE
jgi:hypothetical protein